VSRANLALFEWNDLRNY